MNEEIKNVYEEIIRKQELMKKLETEIKALKAKVTKYHDGEKMVCEDGFQSTISHAERKTLQPDRVTNKILAIGVAHGIELTDEEKSIDDCFKISAYDSLKVVRLDETKSMAVQLENDPIF